MYGYDRGMTLFSDPIIRKVGLKPTVLSLDDLDVYGQPLDEEFWEAVTAFVCGALDFGSARIIYCRDKESGDQCKWRYVYSDRQQPYPLLYEEDLVKMLKWYSEYGLHEGEEV